MIPVLIEVFLLKRGLAETTALGPLGVSWLLVLGGLVVVSWLASHTAHLALSKPAQYAALAGYVAARSIIFVLLQQRMSGLTSAAKWFIGGLLSLKHHVHEPEHAQRRAGIPPARRARQRERFRSVSVADGGRQDACPTLRFMESLHSLWRMHWDYEPTPNPSQEGNRKDADGCLLPSWEGSGVGRFMESLFSLWRMHWDHEPTPNPSQEGNRKDADRCLFPSW